MCFVNSHSRRGRRASAALQLPDPPLLASLNYLVCFLIDEDSFVLVHAHAPHPKNLLRQKWP